MKGAHVMLKECVLPCAVGILLVLVAAVPAWALRCELTVQQYALICDTTDIDAKTVLLRYEMPESLTTASILHARLSGEIAATVGDGAVTMTIEALPVETEWYESTVTWTHPWTSPGGDLDTTHIRSFLARQDEQALRMDVTHAVREWLDGSRDNYGLALRPAPERSGVFSLVEGQGGEPVVPTLRIWYVILEE
jgi:hypothetical protein